MNDENALRQKARQAMRAGRLPVKPPDGMWGGAGDGARCTICGEAIHGHDVEIELEFVHTNGAGSSASSHHLHAQCFAAWELERLSMKAAGAASADHAHATCTAGGGRPLPSAGDAATIADREREPLSEEGSQ